MSDNLLWFDTMTGSQKLKGYEKQTDTYCPFCDRDNLKNILAEDGNIVLVKNKYCVLQDTFQTVLIETDDCHADISTYPKSHLYRLLRFGVNKWLEMENDGSFKSVIFFKNHGRYSGGTVSHPHMQIIGLKKIDYRQNVHHQHFEGIPIDINRNVEFNISTNPLVGFQEFNVILDEINQIDIMSDYIQIAVYYVLNHFNRSCQSYNIFFYHLNDRIYAKIIPRFITSPLFIGYHIPQVVDNIDQTVTKIRKIFF